MKKSLAADATKLTLSKTITMIISMVSAMLLSRIRTLGEYGTYSQILLVTNLTTTFFMMGLPNSINYFLARAGNQEQREKFVSVYYTLSTGLSLITGLILVVSTPLIVNYFENDLIRSFAYVFAFFPWTSIVLSSVDNVLIVCHRTNYLVVFRVLHSVSLLTLIIVVEMFSMGFAWYMLLFVITQALFALSVYWLVGGLVGRIQVCFDSRLAARILKFSLPIGLATVIGTMKRETDVLVIALLYDTESLAIYVNAARELPVTYIAGSITAVLMPQLTRMMRDKRECHAVGLWGQAIVLSYAVICLIAAGVFTYAPEVMSLLYSDKYLPGVPVFRVYSLVLLFRSAYFGMLLNGAGKTKPILYSSLLSFLLNVILNFVFYHSFGFIGPAIATLVTTSLNALYLLWESTKVTKIGMRRIFPWRDLGLITAINIVFGNVFHSVKMTIHLDKIYGENIESIILGIVWGLLYFFVMRKFLHEKWNAMSNS